jgi:hypothetical protein
MCAYLCRAPSSTPIREEGMYHNLLKTPGDRFLLFSYLAASTGITADQRNAINCNEAMLTDSMMPLDKVIVRKTKHSG